METNIKRWAGQRRTEPQLFASLFACTKSRSLKPHSLSKRQTNQISRTRGRFAGNY